MNVQLTGPQVKFLLEITGHTHIQDAVDYFLEIMVMENIEPEKMLVYLNRLMERTKK